jgi:hypothetical protein
MRRFALLLALGSLAGPAFADPLTDALRSAGGTLCFSRTYDSAWLKAHPGQTIRSALFALSKDRAAQSWPALRMELRGPGKPIYLFGGCGWYQGDINRGVQNDVLDPSFKPTSGVGCHMMTDVTGASAEEGGDFPVAWDVGRSIQAHLPDIVAGWRSYDVSRAATAPRLGVADRIIRLNRAPASACRDLVRKFAPGQPDY